MGTIFNWWTTFQDTYLTPIPPSTTPINQSTMVAPPTGDLSFQDATESIRLRENYEMLAREYLARQQERRAIALREEERRAAALDEFDFFPALFDEKEDTVILEREEGDLSIAHHEELDLGLAKEAVRQVRRDRRAKRRKSRYILIAVMVVGLFFLSGIDDPRKRRK